MFIYSKLREHYDSNVIKYEGKSSWPIPPSLQLTDEQIKHLEFIVIAVCVTVSDSKQSSELYLMLHMKLFSPEKEVKNMILTKEELRSNLRYRKWNVIII